MFYVFVLYLTGRHEFEWIWQENFNVTGIYVWTWQNDMFLKWQEDGFGFWSYFSDLLVLMYNLWFAYWADLLVLFYNLWYADLIFSIYFLMYLLIYRLPMVTNAELILNINFKGFRLFHVNGILSWYCDFSILHGFRILSFWTYWSSGTSLSLWIFVTL